MTSWMLDGSVINSNLHLLEEQIFKRIDSVKSALVTDQDFADAESAVKFFKRAMKPIAII